MDLFKVFVSTVAQMKWNKIKYRVDNINYKRKPFQGAAAGVGDGSRRAAMAGNLEVAGAGPRGAVLTRFEDKNIHKLTAMKGGGGIRNILMILYL